MFRDGAQSFDPIIDRSRDLSHSVVRKFYPNPRICMQKWPKRQSHLSWDPSANSADSCDICQRLALLQFSSQPSSNVPGFTKILLESRLVFVQRLSWSCPVCTRKEHSSCFSSLTLDYHEDGLFSQLGLELHRRKKDVSLSRQRRMYLMCFSCRLETRAS